MAELQKPKESKRPVIEREDTLVRIFGQDIKGDKNVYVGLTNIKGISWAISHAVCSILKLKKSTKIVDLGKEEIKRIETFLRDMKIPQFLMNRQKDFQSGDTKHLLATDIDVRKDFDIKRLQQIKSYKGLRHALKLPVRGQRTRSHFRKTGLIVGVKKTKTGKKG